MIMATFIRRGSAPESAAATPIAVTAMIMATLIRSGCAAVAAGIGQKSRIRD